MLPELRPRTRVRLWLSYQRYAFLLVAVPAAALATAAAWGPWWLAALVGVAAIVPVRFAIEVQGRWPRKLRATRVALARIRAGRFRPASVRRYCGDPCFRVVAREILTTAGIPRAERRALVRQFSEQARRDRDVVLLVDHTKGTVITIGAEGQDRPWQ
jgi:hypothetical protein